MPTFEEQMTALEEVVERLEHGELRLEESIRLFEEGRLQVLSARPGGTMVAGDLAVEDDEATPKDE